MATPTTVVNRSEEQSAKQGIELNLIKVEERGHIPKCQGYDLNIDRGVMVTDRLLRQGSRVVARF